MKRGSRFFLNVMILFAIATSAVFLAGCGCNGDGTDKDEVNIDTNKLPDVQIKIKRYEKALFSLNIDSLASELKRIQPEYYFFLEADLDDPENIRQMKDYLSDTHIKENYEACMKKYPDLSFLEKDLSLAFSYYKFIFPDSTVPQVYTYVSGGDYEMPIKYNDSVLIIALDMYLGKKYPDYQKYGLPAYKLKWFDTPYLVRDVMEEVGIPACSNDVQNGTFLDQMIALGKLYYFLDVTLPSVPDSIKIKYSAKEMLWCRQNEGNLWSYFVENKVLFSKDPDIMKKYFMDGPFTTTFGKESPPRVAIWVGWQIVRAYMREQKEKDFIRLIREKDAQKILQISKYKPKKS